MPRPTHRLDLLVVALDEGAADAVRGALDALVADGVVAPGGGPGPRASWLVAGGFGRVRAEVRDAPHLYGNQLGGFRVRCPRCGANVVPALHDAIAGGARSVGCVACGERSDLNALDHAPPAAFGSAALVVADAEDAELTPEAARWLDARLGPWRRVWRRV